MTAPGSPVTLAGFARFCRSEVDAVMGGDEVPSLLFAHGPDFPEPLSVSWQLLEELPDSEELIASLLPAWIARTGASQVGVVVPFGRPRHGVTLVAVDELESVVERSYLDMARLRFGEWKAIICGLDFSGWQSTLADNAGWRKLAKWRCRRCGSVCPADADEVPSPCDYCQSTDIEPADLTTPLRDPDPPWNASIADVLALLDERQSGV